MRLKKFIVGIVFLTVFTCGYTPAGYSFNSESSVRLELTQIKKAQEETLSEQELERRGEGSSTPPHLLLSGKD